MSIGFELSTKVLGTMCVQSSAWWWVLSILSTRAGVKVLFQIFQVDVRRTFVSEVAFIVELSTFWVTKLSPSQLISHWLMEVLIAVALLRILSLMILNSHRRCSHDWSLFSSSSIDFGNRTTVSPHFREEAVG